MKHFEFSKDTFNRMEMAASEDVFDVLMNMEFHFSNVPGVKEDEVYKAVDRCLENKDGNGLAAINYAFFLACGEWREEKYNEDDYEDEEVRKYINEVMVETMSLIAAFFNLYFEDEDGKSFILGYYPM